MLRTKRTAQLLIALCLCAFISAYISLVVYRVLEMTALPRFGVGLASDIASIQDIAPLKKVCTALVTASLELRDKGAFLATWGLWFVLVWSFILGITASFLYRQLQPSHQSRAEFAKENVVDLALAGKLELWKVFWGFYVGLSFASALAMNGSVGLLLKLGALEYSQLISVVAMPIAMSVSVVIYFTSVFAVWRCATNTSRAIWRHLARITIVVCTVLPVVQSLAIVGRTLAR